MTIVKILSEDDLSQVIQLSRKIFNPILNGLDKDENESVWIANYRKNGLVLGAFIEDELAGFIFFYEKDPGGKGIHLWLDGIDKAFRKQGILTSLVTTSVNELKKRGCQYITVSTFPEKFPEMFAFLQKNNFIAQKEENKDWKGETTKKVLFKKKL